MSEYLRIKTGDRIRLLNPIKDGLIDLPQLSHGVIVNSWNQYEADIWFNDMGLDYYDNPIKVKLEVNRADLTGLVLRVNKRNFSVVYNYKEHNEITVDSRKLNDFPFLRMENIKNPINSKWYINNEKGIEYRIEDVIDHIEEEFADWVLDNLKFRKVTKNEKRNGDYPEDWDRVLTDSSLGKYYDKQEELSVKLAEISGLYYKFTGGLLDD